jgi:hypothetical protein
MLTKAMLKLLISKKDRQNLKKTGKFIISKEGDLQSESSSTTSSDAAESQSSHGSKVSLHTRLKTHFRQRLADKLQVTNKARVGKVN